MCTSPVHIYRLKISETVGKGQYMPKQARIKSGMIGRVNCAILVTGKLFFNIYIYGLYSI